MTHVDIESFTGAEMILAEKVAREKILGNESVTTGGMYALFFVAKLREDSKVKYEDILDTVTIKELNASFDTDPDPKA